MPLTLWKGEIFLSGTELVYRGSLLIPRNHLMSSLIKNLFL